MEIRAGRGDTFVISKNTSNSFKLKEFKTSSFSDCLACGERIGIFPNHNKISLSCKNFFKCLQIQVSEQLLT